MAKRKKHVPQRTCVGCRQVLSKRELIRVVRSPDGVKVDLTGKMSGRGAYLHNQQSCWKLGLQGRLEKALKTTLAEADRDELRAFAESIPADNSPSE